VYRALFADVDKAIATGARALVKRQDRDGCWRDFSLPPGRSEAWSTAWTGWCIGHADPCAETFTAMRCAASALMRHGRSTGWGYNSTTGSDADSTAWAVRFLAVIAPRVARSGATVLDRYVDACGDAHTFLELAKGTWSEAHADVTPVVGLALLCAKAHRNNRIKQIRRAILLRSQAGWPPKTFWWTNQTYGLAWTLVFLAVLESVPSGMARDSERWLEAQEIPPDAMGKAIELLAWVALARWNHPRAIGIGCDLIAGVSIEGWPGSASLLVPPQRVDSSSDGGQCGPFSDSGIMSTGIAVAALARWRRAASIRPQP
jgi:hypothetical protein